MHLPVARVSRFSLSCYCRTTPVPYVVNPTQSTGNQGHPHLEASICSKTHIAEKGTASEEDILELFHGHLARSTEKARGEAKNVGAEEPKNNHKSDVDHESDETGDQTSRIVNLRLSREIAKTGLSIKMLYWYFDSVQATLNVWGIKRALLHLNLVTVCSDLQSSSVRNNSRFMVGIASRGGGEG